VAAGDVLAAFLCANGALSTDPAIKTLTVRGLGLYVTFHMGAFLWGHLSGRSKGEPHPPVMVGFYCASLLAAIAGVLRWG
jgi:hypothetical protein